MRHAIPAGLSPRLCAAQTADHARAKSKGQGARGVGASIKEKKTRRWALKKSRGKRPTDYFFISFYFYGVFERFSPK
jgi:hypothetical protein